MNEKLSFQNIADVLVQRTGVQKKVSEIFTKAFFDTIIEALYMGEDTIKVKGLGTFKLVVVGSRESVNVSNGERIVISGYKKVSFTPEDSVVGFLNRNNTPEEQPVNVESEPVEVVEKKKETMPQQESNEVHDNVEDRVVENRVEDSSDVSSAIETEIVQEEKEVFEELSVQENVTQADDTVELDALLQTVVPDRVEIPQDEFAGIDMLISTPESVDEVRQQLADATCKMDEAVEVARKAVEKKLRLQKLLERLEANVEPECVECDSISEEVKLPEQDDVSFDKSSPIIVENEDEEMVMTLSKITEEPQSHVQESSLEEDEEEKKNRAFERVMQAPKEEENHGRRDDRKKRIGMVWFITIAILLLIVAIVFFLYKTFISIDAVKDVALPQEIVQPVEQKDEPDVQPAIVDDTISVSESTTDTVAVLPETDEKPQQAPQPTEDEKPKRPSFYTVKKGESLTRISQRFYGTKDSVRAIIRINNLTDPNNVRIGAKIKLP